MWLNVYLGTMGMGICNLTVVTCSSMAIATVVLDVVAIVSVYDFSNHTQVGSSVWSLHVVYCYWEEH